VLPVNALPHDSRKCVREICWQLVQVKDHLQSAMHLALRYDQESEGSQAPFDGLESAVTPWALEPAINMAGQGCAMLIC